MTDMLSLFDADVMVDELGVPPYPRRVVPSATFTCPEGCPGPFPTWPAFLGHLSGHQPVSL